MFTLPMSGVTSRGFTIGELRSAHARCSYPSKMCMNPRAVKLCGSLHKMCEFHRRKANLNQKRMQQRRRVVRAQMQQHEPSSPSQQHYDDDRHERQLTSSSSPSAVNASSLQLSFGSGLDAEDTSREKNPLQIDELTDQDAQLMQSFLFSDVTFSRFVFGSGDDDGSPAKAQPESVGAMETLEYELCL